MAHLVCPDVWRRIVPTLTLWDARSLQNAHPVFGEVVHEVTQETVQRAIERPCPPCINAFLIFKHGFQERMNRDFVCLHTPKDITIQYVCDRVVTQLYVVKALGKDHHFQSARVEVRIVDHSAWPTFGTLERTLAAVWWFATAVRDRGVRHVDFVTKAALHHPPTEVLNTLATTFVERKVFPMFGCSVAA